MSEPRCDRCKFWTAGKPPELPEYGPGSNITDGLGECSRAMPYWDATEWKYNPGGDSWRVMKPEYADRRFFAQDASDYIAVVITRGDFFCADFTEEPPHD